MSREIEVPSAPADLEHAPMTLSLQCRHCAMIAYPGDRFCACCGSRLSPACRRCGSHRRHPVANYCTHCGVVLDEPEKIGPVAISAAGEAAGSGRQDPDGERPVA